MSRALKIAGIVVIVLVVALSVLWWRFLSAAGYFTAINAEIPADCFAIPSVPGPEDIVIDHASGTAFVAATDRRSLMAGKNIRGGIYTMDLNLAREQRQLLPVTASIPEDFRPLGLSLYRGADGARRLFVVNQPAAQAQRVEIFDIAADNMLTHVKSVSDPLLVSLNDVQAVGPDSFYVTNDHITLDRTRNMLGDILLLRRGNVAYYDGNSVRIVAGPLAFPDGINISPDGSRVYVGEITGMALHVYTRNAETGDLTASDFTRLGTALDNIDVQPDGALLIAASPKMLRVLKHVEDPAELSPSQIVRIEPKAEGGGRAGTIYLNLGEQVSAASVAAGYKDEMLIGSIFGDRILSCHQSKELKSFGGKPTFQ
jgi:arylesterase/paraoxonase